MFLVTPSSSLVFLALHELAVYVAVVRNVGLFPQYLGCKDFSLFVVGHSDPGAVPVGQVGVVPNGAADQMVLAV